MREGGFEDVQVWRGRRNRRDGARRGRRGSKYKDEQGKVLQDYWCQPCDSPGLRGGTKENKVKMIVITTIMMVVVMVMR